MIVVMVIIVVIVIVSSSSLLWSGSFAFGILLNVLFFFQAFYPPPVYDENSEVDEDVLKRVIDDALVSDAIAVFSLLQKKKKSESCQTTDNARPNDRYCVVGFHKFQVADWWTMAQKPIILVCPLGVFFYYVRKGSTGEPFCQVVIVDNFLGNHKAPTNPQLRNISSDQNYGVQFVTENTFLLLPLGFLTSKLMSMVEGFSCWLPLWRYVARGNKIQLCSIFSIPFDTVI